jgi:DNA-binding LacI/PurR family transcriptional regulator
MVTIKTVAEKAGVSPTTASYALNGRPGVKPETLEKVIQAAKELDYIPNSLAQNFRNGKSDTIAVLSRESLEDNSIFALELMGILSEARKMKYDVLIKTISDENDLHPDPINSIFASKRADGIILLGNGFESLIERMTERSANMVLLSSHSKFNINVVNVDGEKWIYNITEYLIKKGFKKINYMTFALQTIEELNRERGFRKALADYGLANMKTVVECGYEQLKIFQSVYDAVKVNGPQAIVCWNDVLAMKVIKVLKEIGLKVPEDIAVTGFDDIVEDIYFTPRLTTVKQPFAEKGKCAMRLLGEIINSKPSTPVKQLVECSLIIGDST